MFRYLAKSDVGEYPTKSKSSSKKKDDEDPPYLKPLFRFIFRKRK